MTVSKNPKYGATCGRVAGRISNASFTIKDVPGRWYTSDQTYYLEANNGTNCLHSGSEGFWKRNWDAEIVNSAHLSDFVTLKEGQDDVKFKGVKFMRESPDGECGFPGTLIIESWYLLSQNDELLMIWKARFPDD